MTDNRSYNAGYNQSSYDYTGSLADYRRGAADRAQADRAHARALEQSLPTFKPPTYVPTGGGGGMSGTSSLTLLAAFAAAWFVVWPWLVQVGFTRKIASFVLESSHYDWPSCLIVAAIAQFFLLLMACGFVARAFPWIGLLGSAALMYFHFKQ